jgi:hypothetical protein
MTTCRIDHTLYELVIVTRVVWMDMLWKNDCKSITGYLLKYDVKPTKYRGPAM